MNSFNHYAYGAIGAWLYAVVVGIDGDFEKPGFKHILLKPQPGGGLSFAKATYDSVHGRIESSWIVENGYLHWEVCVPPNTTATAFIPAQPGCTVTESGNTLGMAEGISSIQEGENTVICELGSGKYRFTVEPFSDKIKREEIS
jgi:alpha-L-rhamnosidase